MTDLAGVNFRSLPEALQAQLKDFDFLTMDISFISACLMVESMAQVLKDGGEAMILIKPQFEAGPGAVNRQGVVKDPARHVEVLIRVLDCYLSRGFRLKGLTHSPIQGPHGNIEYLCYLTLTKDNGPCLPAGTQGADGDPVKDRARETVETAFRAFGN